MNTTTKFRPESLIIGKGDVRRVSCQTAMDDHNVELEPGVYPLRYTTVDFQPCAPESAYWVHATIPATRTQNGTRFGTRGDRVTYALQQHAYTVEVPR